MAPTLEKHSSSDENSITGSPEPDVYILTSGGRRISAHSSILGSVSPVIGNIINRSNSFINSKRVISILGVPCDAVSAFVEFLYSSRCTDEHFEKFGMHLLVLSHFYSIQRLKQKCIKVIIQNLEIDNVIDVLELAKLCDAPELHLKCMRLIYNQFKVVEQTEGWKFMQENDPWLELEALQFIDNVERRKRRTKRHGKEQRLYLQLNDAMECLEHICTEGCTNVGPRNTMDSANRKIPCNRFSTCQGLQLSIKHFATCRKKVNGGCLRCKRMWQLLRLHSSICDQPDDSCKVPLCRRFKLRSEQDPKKESDDMWNMLVRKVISAKAMANLAMFKKSGKDGRLRGR